MASAPDACERSLSGSDPNSQRYSTAFRKRFAFSHLQYLYTTLSINGEESVAARDADDYGLSGSNQDSQQNPTAPFEERKVAPSQPMIYKISTSVKVYVAAPDTGDQSLSGSDPTSQQCSRAFVKGFLYLRCQHLYEDRSNGGDQSVANVNPSSFEVLKPMSSSGVAEREAWNMGSIADSVISHHNKPSPQEVKDLILMKDGKEMGNAFISHFEKICTGGITWANVISLLHLGLAAVDLAFLEGKLDKVFLLNLAIGLEEAFFELKLRQWIQEQGGWNGLLQFMKRIDMRWLMGTLTVGCAVATVYAILRKP